LRTSKSKIEMLVKKTIPATITAALVIASLSGCMGAPVSSSSPDKPGSSGASLAPEPEVEEEADLSNLEFGSAATYRDNVSISVSAPAEFSPTEYAAGADQPAQVLFTMTITNGSEANLQPATYTRVSSGGVEASTIYDSGNPAGELLGGPTTVILPGGTITWLEAFSVADPSNIILQIAPSYEYTDSIFTNVK
jgi:hypothetical protein